MELAETINTINQQLRDNFGIDTVTDQPIWRVVWTNEQTEKKLDDYTDWHGNIFIRTVREVREVLKYPFNRDRYALERLVLVPEVNLTELVSSKLSYEPLWIFENSKGYLPPKYIVCKFLIDTVYAAQYGTKNLRKYVDDEENQEKSIESKSKRVNEIMEYLYGDESGLLGTTITGESVIVPNNFEGSK